MSKNTRLLEVCRKIKTFTVALTFVTGSVTAAEQQQSIPARFHGEWNILEYCGTNSDSQLRISANRIDFYESGGPVRAVVTQGEFDLALIAELSGEGETWLSYSFFRLSEDGSSLTAISRGRPDFVRNRCSESLTESSNEDQLTQAFADCSMQSGGVTARMLNCISGEKERQDARLNRNYQELMLQLDDTRKEQLRNAQRL